MLLDKTYRMAEYISSQRPDLNSPGVDVDMVYYTPQDIQVSKTEMSCYVGRYNQSISSLNFGSTSQIVIPNQDMVYECYLHVKLPPTIANQVLPRGWLFDAIREVSFTFGQSNVSNLRLSGQSVRHLCLESCETKEKRSELLVLAGESFNGDSAGINPEGTIIIPLPWSNTSGDHKKKPIDTSLLNNPITIQITFYDSNRIYGGSATRPTSMAAGSVFLRQGEFSDRANSIKRSLMANPSMKYFYPFLHKTSPTPKYNIVMDGTTINSVELKDFIESDLQAIIFSVHNTGLQFGDGVNAPTPGVSAECLDVEVLYNGQTLYSSPGASARLVNMNHTTGASGYDDVALNQTTPWAANALVSYVYIIPFSSLAPINFAGYYDNSLRYSSQNMQLRFKCRQIPGAAGIGQLEATYIYNGIASIQGGVCTIDFA